VLPVWQDTGDSGGSAGRLPEGRAARRLEPGWSVGAAALEGTALEGVLPVGPCSECGAPSGICDELFHTLLALDHSRQPPWGPLHGVSVACFLLQHPGRSEASRRGREGELWELVRGYIDGGLAAVDWIVRRARWDNSRRGSRAGGASPEDASSSAVPGVATGPFAVTIEDVAVDGTFPADGFADRLAAWAAATLSAAAPPGA
jgi:hypothetical protein